MSRTPPLRRRGFPTALVICARTGFGIFAPLVCAAFSFAAEPTLTHLYPAAGQQGTNISVTAGGKFDPWPPQVWVDAPGITFTVTPITGMFHVEIAPDAAVGAHLVRLFNEQGASVPRFFIVSREPELREMEPNDAFQSPQKIAALPATVSGRLDKAGDVDSWAVPLKQGQTLVAWVEAYVLGSAFDGMLRVVDPSGTQLAFNHDGRTLDPFLAWAAPHDGTFVVQIMGFAYPPASEIRLTGGEDRVYRLHFTAGPFVRYTLPLAIQRGKKSPVQLVGWNLTALQAEVDATNFAPQLAAIELPLPGMLSDRALPISDLPEVLENESRDAPSAAQPLDIPSAVTGRIYAANDEDRYTFSAMKDRIYELKLTGARVGSPLDAWLKIESAEGKELARNDDAAGSSDPQLTWTAPADGVFSVTVGDLTHRGGDDFVYRLAIVEAAPAVTATVASHFFNLPAGKTSEIKVAVKRTHGFKPKLQIAVKNLPEGVTAPAVEVPEKDGDVTLKLTADAGAKPASQPFQLVLRETESGKEHPVRYFVRLGSDDQGFTELVIDSTDQLWLTVLVEPPK